MDEDLNQAGATLANIAFNLAQRVGQPIDQQWADNMRDAQKAWDAARRERLARQVPEWMDIETAPKDGTSILLAMLDDGAGAGIVAQGHWQKGWGDAPDEMGCDDGFVDCVYQEFSPSRSFGAEEYRHAGVQPTHWMPLPAAPKAAEAKTDNP